MPQIKIKQHDITDCGAACLAEKKELFLVEVKKSANGYGLAGNAPNLAEQILPNCAVVKK